MAAQAVRIRGRSRTEKDWRRCMANSNESRVAMMYTPMPGLPIREGAYPKNFKWPPQPARQSEAPKPDIQIRPCAA